jgi:antirestriction protein
MIEAYITNLGKYNEGELCGEYLKFPAEKTDLQALLARIGVDGVLYEEIIITDYRTNIDGLCTHLSEYENIDELNHLSAVMSDMDDSELEKFAAAIAYGEHTSSVKDLINLTQNLDNYEFYPGVESEEDLGRYYVDELGALKIPEHLESYFDYEAYGRDMHFNGGGVFSQQCGGYIENNYNGFTEHYGGRGDIPEEHRIFAYPDPPDKMPIVKQLEMYAKMINAHQPPKKLNLPVTKGRNIGSS